MCLGMAVTCIHNSPQALGQSERSLAGIPSHCSGPPVGAGSGHDCHLHPCGVLEVKARLGTKALTLLLGPATAVSPGASGRLCPTIRHLHGVPG